MDETLKFNGQLLKDTKRFIDLYRRGSMKEHVNRLIDSGLRVTFQGRPLLLYAKIVAETARGQAQQHRELIAAGLPGKYELLYRASRSNRVEIKNLFEQVTFDEKRFRFIESALNQNLTALPKEILIPLAETDKLPETPEKAEKMEKIVAKYDQLPAQPIQTTEVVEALVKPKEILATPKEINKGLLSYKETSKKEIKYTPPEDLKKLDRLFTTPTPQPEKSAPGTLPIKESKIIPAVTQGQVVVPVIPEKPVLVKQISQPIPPTPPTPQTPPVLKPIEKPKTTPEKTSVPVKGPEITKTGKKYPLKVARGSGEAVIPIPKPQAIAPTLPKVEIPRITENLRQKISALRHLKAPYPVQSLAKNTLSFGKRLIIRNAPTVVSATIGGIVGGALVGPAGIPAGLVGGGLFPKVIKSGLLQKGATASVAKGAGKLALKGALGLSNPVGWAWLALSAPGVKTAVKYAMIAFLAIFALPIFMNLNKSQSLFPPYDTAYSAPLPPGGSIPVNLSCKFTRDDQTPKDASFNSTLLLSYFQEASQISGVPAVLLAAIARVESPGSVNLTNSDIAGYADNRCAVSGTGALGIMQIQPPNTTGYFSQGVEFAAQQYLNTTPDKLTRTDFCNPRTNTILSAGFIIKKTYAMLGSSGNQWSSNWLSDKSVIDKIAEGYYGCLQYGAGTNRCEGPYNYGNDLWKSIQSCKTVSPPQPAPINYVASCPVPGGTISTPSYFANKSTGHCGGSYKYECNCGTTGRRAKAIDVPTNGKDVLLPTIDGKPVKWSLILKGYPVEAGEGGGVGHTFEAKVGQDWWYLDILHMQQTELSYGKEYTSGTPIGKSAAAHAHMTIGKNNERKPTSPGLNANTTDCDPGWLASDFICQ